MAPAKATVFNPNEAQCTEELDLEVIHDFAIDLILRAGALLKRHTLLRAAQSRQGGSNALSSASASALAASEVKASQVDLVTKVDVLIEDFIRSEIQHAWPKHEIVAEESAGGQQRWSSGRGPCWFVDPLDGTLNATHLLPLHCISIGFTCSHRSDNIDVPDDPLVGAIYAPSMGATGTLWSGARGHGAYMTYPSCVPTDEKSSASSVQHQCHLASLNVHAAGAISGQSSHVQQLPLVVQPMPKDAPSGILFASEWGKDRRRSVKKEDGKTRIGNLARKMKTMTNVAANDYIPAGAREPSKKYVHGVRSLGSSTLDLAFVAQGSIDVLWEGGCWEWDVCAGVALLLEAGGLLTDSNPPPSKTSLYWTTSSVPRAELGARRFLAVRGCAQTEIEDATTAQERVVREIWTRTDGLDYRRDGVKYAIETAEETADPGVISEAAASPKATSSVRNWQASALQERKRLTKEEALKQTGAPVEDEGTFGGRLLDEEKDPWAFNAWDHVDPPASYMEMIEDKLNVQRQTQLSSDEAAAFHSAPSSYWNAFYTQHENRFFKDRRWLHLEFPELIAASKADAPPMRILEVGCGAGNTVFPLMEVNQNAGLHMFACDYAPEAVSVVKSNPLYTNPPCGKCTASVWDLSSATQDGLACLPDGVEAHSLDIVVLIFVLSALHPNEWQRAIRNVCTLLKPGGLVLVRDYGRHDLPQIRFGKGRMLDDNFYIRGDGTRVYFFTPDEFLQMFNATQPAPTLPREQQQRTLPASINETTQDQTGQQEVGKKDFKTLQLAVDRRMLLNRKEKKQMFRNWLQAKFQYTP